MKTNRTDRTFTFLLLSKFYQRVLHIFRWDFQFYSPKVEWLLSKGMLIIMVGLDGKKVLLLLGFLFHIWWSWIFIWIFFIKRQYIKCVIFSLNFNNDFIFFKKSSFFIEKFRIVNWDSFYFCYFFNF